MATDLILKNAWALGDTVCLSALVRDIQLAHPGKFNLHMSGHYQSYWRHCPHASPMKPGVEGRLITPQYQEGIKEAGRGTHVHFLSWFHRDFERQMKVKVPLTRPHGEIYLPREDTNLSPYPFRYWVVVAGCKVDMTTKQWDVVSWQRTVSALRKKGIVCVQAGANFARHYHAKLRDVVQAVGTTDDIQKLFRLIYHADGVVCGITAAMHVAAAFEKPCVVIAGGREEPWWEAYTNCYTPKSFGPECSPVRVEHTYLHTVGMLDCCETKGCWKDRVVPIEADDLSVPRNKRQLCKRPLRLAHQNVPECMALITPEMVVDAVMNYYEKGYLPPVGPTLKQESEPKIPPGKCLVSVGAYELVNDKGERVGTSTDLNPGVITAHSVDNSTDPPTEHVTITYPELWPEVDAKQLGKVFPKEYVPRAPEDKALSILDHPTIGGKYTVCVLGYGDNKLLFKRCINSILQHVPAHRLDIRVALNQPSPDLLEYVTDLGTTFTKTYIDYGERKKYPAMREMFWDLEHPITTPYVLWFDDDSHVVDKKWLVRLSEVIIKNHHQGCRLYGTKCFHDLMSYHKAGFNPQKWFQEATWWKGVWMHASGGARLANNGHQILFVTGGFWALARNTIVAGDIPDTRLNHNGGDITIGEQVHQAGFKICDFSRNKTPVRWSDAERRGFSENFPWAKYI